MSAFNKNERQKNFNSIKGVIAELDFDVRFGFVTLHVGHERQREVTLTMKKTQYEQYKAIYKIGDRVLVKFFLTTRKEQLPSGGLGRITMANVLDIEKVLT